mmetsp:Transcript_21096/g.68008  ORF Transcript_21096/g.68008 Transcript_21096/m.68008 type:complete len:223 (-) Transcript_21096:1257-1925(-)
MRQQPHERQPLLLDAGPCLRIRRQCALQSHSPSQSHRRGRSATTTMPALLATCAAMEVEAALGTALCIRCKGLTWTAPACLQHPQAHQATPLACSLHPQSLRVHRGGWHPLGASLRAGMAPSASQTCVPRQRLPPGALGLLDSACRQACSSPNRSVGLRACTGKAPPFLHSLECGIERSTSSSSGSPTSQHTRTCGHVRAHPRIHRRRRAQQRSSRTCQTLV